MAKKIDVNGLDHYHDKVSAMLASEYSSSKTYAVGDYCFHAGTLYECTTAITTAENWTSGHWTAAKLADDTSALKTVFNPVLEEEKPWELLEERGTNASSGSGSTNNTFTNEFKANSIYDYKIVLKASVALSADTNIYFRNSSTGNLNLICKMLQGETEKTVYAKPTADCTIIRWSISDSGARYTSTVYARGSAIRNLENAIDETNDDVDEIELKLIHYNDVSSGEATVGSSSVATINLSEQLIANTVYRVNIKSSSEIGTNCNVYYRDTVAGSNRNFIGEIKSGEDEWTFDVAPNNTANAIRINSGNATTYTVTVTIPVDAIADLYKRVENIEIYEIPDYWDNEIADSVSKINANKLLIGEHGVEFFFITDTHWESNAQHSNDLVNYLSKECTIPSVVFGGDAIKTYNPTKSGAVRELRTFYKAFYKDFELRSTIGNHDTNTVSNSDSSTYLSDAELYALMLRSDEERTIEAPDVLSGYWDNVSQKVRYIQVYKPYPQLGEDVQTWVDARITELESDWNVILISHAMFEAMENDQPHMPSSAASVVQHFANLTADADIICWIVGHCHYDANDNTNGLMVISTQTDNYTMSTQYGGATMTLGTDTEQAFDCYQIDTQNKVIYITRVGAGNDRQVSYGS